MRPPRRRRRHRPRGIRRQGRDPAASGAFHRGAKSLTRLPPTRRGVLAGTLGGAAAAAVAPASPWTASAAPREILNDASLLNPTPVAKHVFAGNEPEADFVALLRRELKAAQSEKRPFVCGVARHSMGGQSLARDGLAFSLRSDGLEIDRDKRVFRARAGLRWHQVIGALDKIGLSPAVTPSNSDFGVSSTFCVNAHGWPVPFGPFGSTVRAIRLMLADGTVFTASREENGELFRHAMGGYGVGSSRVDLQACKLEYSIVSPK